MRYGPLALALSVVSACSLFSSTPAPPSNAQAVAAKSVATAADAWNLATETCLTLAGATDPDAAPGNPAMAHECFVVLQPIHDAIVGAQVAVSVWDNVAQANFPCLMQQIAVGLGDAVAMLHAPSAVADAAIVALQFGHSCADAGK